MEEISDMESVVSLPHLDIGNDQALIEAHRFMHEDAENLPAACKSEHDERPLDIFNTNSNANVVVCDDCKFEQLSSIAGYTKEKYIDAYKMNKVLKQLSDKLTSTHEHVEKLQKQLSNHT